MEHGPEPSSRLQPIVAAILDWRFHQYQTMRLLPLFYLLLLSGAIVGIVVLVGLAFVFSGLAGLVALAVSPLALLVTIAVIRAVLEYLVMAHRMMRIVERMEALPDQVRDLATRVDGITSDVERLVAHVEDINETLAPVRPILRSGAWPKQLIRSLLRKGDG